VAWKAHHKKACKALALSAAKNWEEAFDKIGEACAAEDWKGTSSNPQQLLPHPCKNPGTTVFFG
jgi:hypothetical protein